MPLALDQVPCTARGVILSRVRSCLCLKETKAVTSAAAVFLALFVSSSRAEASAVEVHGFGPAGVAEVNARCARADDGTATFYNPGGLGLGRGYHVEVSPQLGASALSAQGQT